MAKSILTWSKGVMRDEYNVKTPETLGDKGLSEWKSPDGTGFQSQGSLPSTPFMQFSEIPLSKLVNLGVSLCGSN